MSQQNRRRQRVATRVPVLPDDLEVPVALRQPPPKSVVVQLPPVSSGTAAPSGEEGAVSGQERYRVREEIGIGGMGRVLKVEDTDLNREIAMKVLLSGKSSQGSVRRFIEEAQIASQLQHPNMLPVHDFGINADGDVFFTMQYVSSHETIGDLTDKLRDGDPDYHERFSFERRVQLIQQVCDALAYAHERGVIHRDLKPSNVMIGEHGEVYLVDWGVAKLIDQPDRKAPRTLRTDDASSEGTQDGALIGTPPYMAPEQILGLNNEVDAITDVYALVAMLYEFLTLNYYLGAVKEDLGAIQAAILNRKPRDAESFKSRHNRRVPRALSRICRKGLQKKREGRYQSATELRQALQRWLEGNAPIVCPGTAMQRGLSRFSRVIDLHPVLVPAVSITTAVLLVAWLVLATVTVLST